MGLLPNIGKMIGVKVSPKGVAVGAPKMNLMDALTVGSLAAGGVGNIGTLGKWSTGNMVKGLGLNGLGDLAKGKVTSQAVQSLAMLSTLAGSGQKSTELGSGDSLSGFIPGLMALTEEDIARARTDSAAKAEMAKRLRAHLDPANINAENKAFEANTRGANQASAQVQAGLANNLGMSQLGNAISLNAENETRNAASENRNKTHDPQAVAQRFAGILALYDDDPEMINHLYQVLNGQQQLQSGKYALDQQRPASLLETLMPTITEYLNSGQGSESGSGAIDVRKDPSIFNQNYSGNLGGLRS